MSTVHTATGAQAGSPRATKVASARGGRVQRALRVVSWVGLGLSTLTFVIGLPDLVRTGGAINVLGNAAEFGWTVLLLGACFARTRTIGPKAVAGAFFAGFFGTTTMALLVGRPAIGRFGADSLFAVVLWAPATEELLKLLPVATFLLVSLLNRRARPAVADAVLFGVTVAAGFALREDAAYGRGTGGGWFSHPPFSVLVPSLSTMTGGDHTMVVGGHITYTALNALALGVTIAYWRRFPWARLAAPIALADTIAEHMTVNQFSIVGFGEVPPWATMVNIFSLGGYLSSILLVAGLVTVTLIEWRVVRIRNAAGGLRAFAWPDRTEVGRRMALYAAARMVTRPLPDGAGVHTAAQESR